VTTHSYRLALRWTGNRGSGTADYRAYDRDHELSAPGKATIAGSSDPAFRGDGSRWNPEELLVASLSQCHLLWYLHLAATAGVVVTAYDDEPSGQMDEDGDLGGRFTEVVLRPRVQVLDQSMVATAQALHERVGEVCFVARSVAFPVRHEATTTV